MSRVSLTARAWALKRSERCGLKIALEGRHTRGATLVDHNQRLGWPAQAEIVHELDADALATAMRSALA